MDLKQKNKKYTAVRRNSCKIYYNKEAREGIQMKALKKGMTIFVSLILWAVILLAALFAFTTLATRDNAKVANVAGFTPMIVKSDSMAPTFYAGDLIIVKKCDPQTLKEGDIITFHTIINNEYALNHLLVYRR